MLYTDVHAAAPRSATEHHTCTVLLNAVVRPAASRSASQHRQTRKMVLTAMYAQLLLAVTLLTPQHATAPLSTRWGTPPAPLSARDSTTVYEVRQTTSTAVSTRQHHCLRGEAHRQHRCPRNTNSTAIYVARHTTDAAVRAARHDGNAVYAARHTASALSVQHAMTPFFTDRARAQTVVKSDHGFRSRSLRSRATTVSLFRAPSTDSGSTTLPDRAV